MTDERRTYTIDETARILGLGRSAAYDAARRGDLPVTRIGRRLLVSRAKLEQLLEGSPPEKVTTRPAA